MEIISTYTEAWKDQKEKATVDNKIEKAEFH